MMTLAIIGIISGIVGGILLGMSIGVEIQARYEESKRMIKF